MRVNLVEKGGVLIVEDALFRTLKSVYTTEGLWLEIDEISIDFSATVVPDDPVVTIKVRYGRSLEGGSNNFCSEAFISCDEREVDLQFLCGRFFQHLDTEEIKYIH